MGLIKILLITLVISVAVIASVHAVYDIVKTHSLDNTIDDIKDTKNKSVEIINDTRNDVCSITNITKLECS